MIKKHHPENKLERKLLKEKHNVLTKEERADRVWKRLQREALKRQEIENELREGSLGSTL